MADMKVEWREAIQGNWERYRREMLEKAMRGYASAAGDEKLIPAITDILQAMQRKAK